MGSWILPLYSILTYIAGLKTVDYIVEGFDRSKMAIIITENSKDISSALSEFFGCGLTITEATCTEPGFITYTCVTCGDTYNEDSVNIKVIFSDEQPTYEYKYKLPEQQ